MKSINLRRKENSMPGLKALLAIVVAFCIGHTQSFAQMKVGNNPTTIDASSMLEVEATNQGILLPRISIGNIATWGLAGATPVSGMFVYNSNAATTGGSGIGIYYWANAKWNYVQNGAAANTAWLLTGNASTTPGTYAVPGTNFIGTTDGVDFAVRTTNAERMRISAAGQIGVNQNYVVTQQLAVTTGVAANTAVVGQNTTASGASTGIGVLGTTLQSAGYGVNGTNGNAGGIAILGQNTVASGTGGNGIGVEGLSAQSYNAVGPTNGYGVVALNSNTNGTGLYAGGNNVGLNSNFLLTGSGAALVGTNIGGFGYSTAGAGIGIYGNNTGASGIGVYGVNSNTTAFQMGVYGTYNTAGYGTGVIGLGYNGTIPGSASTIDVGVYGSANNYGIFGYSTISTGIGVFGQNTSTGIGVYGASVSTGVGARGDNTSTGIGVYGRNTGTGIGVFGFSQSTGIGVYGTNNNATSMGVLGENTNATGTGMLGVGNNLGGFYLTNGQGGAFTGNSTGGWGYIPIVTDGGVIGTSYSTGSYGLFGRADYYRTSSNNNAVYQFGVYGEKIMGYNAAGTGGWDKRAGGVLGTIYDIVNLTVPVWGSLGYKSSSNTNGTHYGVYATTAITVGTGFSEGISKNGFGMGIYGGLMGGWVRGNVYGMNVKGERYGMYVDGYSYTNKPTVQLIDNGGAERTVAYNVSSLSADVYAHGKGQMVNGKAVISFDRAFQQIVDENDLAVTVTPVGESNGIHLVSSGGNGFSVQENKNADQSFGTSNAVFTWIAVGKRKDVKTSDIAKEVLSKDFDKNMEGVMFNENDLSQNAGGMEITNNNLKFYPVEKSDNPNSGKNPGLKQMAKKNLDSMNISVHGKNPVKENGLVEAKPATPPGLKIITKDKASEDKKQGTPAPPAKKD